MNYLLAAFCGVSDPNYISDVITPIVATSIMLMVVLISFFWMAAQLLRKPEYESFATVETHQLLASLLFFLFVFGISCTASTWADMYAGGDMFEIGRNYLNFISGSVALPSVVNLEMLKLWSQFWGSWTMRWGASVWGVVIPSFPSFVVIERVLDFLLLLISPFTASLMVQMGILEFIRGAVLPYVLPAGVVLRIFPPTRDAGAFLIASAMGFGIIYPFTYVIHDKVVKGMIAADAGKNVVETLGQTGWYPNLAVSISISGLFDADTMLFKPLRLLSYLMLQALFLPALSITLTIAFIKSTSKFISQKLA